MPRGSRTLTRALSVALLSSAVLTACVPFGTDADAERLSAGPSAATTSTSSPTAPAAALPAPTPTPSLSPAAYPPLGPLPDGVAPARPAALDGPPTLDGAKAVATYFLLLYPYVYQSGDLQVWNSISDPRCAFCASVQQNAKDQRSRGQRLAGGALTVNRIEGTEVNVGSFFDVIVNLTQAPSKTVSTFGAVISETMGGDVSADIVVTFVSGEWQVRELSTKSRNA